MREEDSISVFRKLSIPVVFVILFFAKTLPMRATA